METETINLSRHLAEFKENGYTVFPQLFDEGQIAEWRNLYDEMRRELYGDEDERSSYCFTNIVERRPQSMLKLTAHSVILDFLEMIMGPFVQIGDANFNGFAPVSKESVHGKVNGWHRDMFGFSPRGTDYQIPRQALVLTYLEDMTEEFGPFRVLPGSHRKESFIRPEDRGKPHPDEVKLSLRAGDAIAFSGILHSGTPNTSGRHRIFIGGMYTYTWYRPTCNFEGPNIKQLVKQAEERNDRRMLRLLGVYGKLEQSRANSGFTVPEEQVWKEWAEQDKAAIIGPADWWKGPIGN